jgi:hypothetical protein
MSAVLARPCVNDVFSPVVSDLSIINDKLAILADELSNFNDFIGKQESKMDISSDKNFQENAAIYAFKSYLEWYRGIVNDVSHALITAGITLTRTKHTVVIHSIERIRK